MEQLAFQQQLMQMQQQHFLNLHRQGLAGLPSGPGAGPIPNLQQAMGPPELQRLWKEAASVQTATEDSGNPEGLDLSTSSSNATSYLTSKASPKVSHHSLLNGQSSAHTPKRDSPSHEEQVGLNPLYGHGECKWPGARRSARTLGSSSST
ncbi:hypothetical protein MATL_G00110650 [Megalops atlanticus]|uniref:Uncharacterized protein n=1 Tax=Megalops atlanticus TaxID=7932 RepID=A0A9D3TCJ5_MEGAT|nr:hypothetical protein MATL_G00110650 [Megalops atlanticus]